MTADQPVLISWWDHSPGQAGASAEMGGNLQGWAREWGVGLKPPRPGYPGGLGREFPFPPEWPMFHDHVGVTQELIFNKALSII